MIAKRVNGRGTQFTGTFSATATEWNKSCTSRFAPVFQRSVKSPGTCFRHERHVLRRWLWRSVRVAFLRRGRGVPAVPGARTGHAARARGLESAQRPAVSASSIYHHYIERGVWLLLNERVFPGRAPEHRQHEHRFPERRHDRNSGGYRQRSRYWLNQTPGDARLITSALELHWLLCK